MATTTTNVPESSQSRLTKEQFDELVAFVRDYYRDELGEFLQKYPDDTTQFEIAYRDLESGVTMSGMQSFAEAFLDAPEDFEDDLAEALDQVDMPVDMNLTGATVQVVDLPQWYTFYPGGFSPNDESGHYRSITGEVSRATDVYAKIEVAAFECQRCGTFTDIPQSGSGFQEPHECQGCERQGPFDVDLDHSELIDAQKLRLQTPPEVAQGAGHDIDVFVEDELADVATVGDRITVTGTIHLEQQSKGNTKTGKFYPYVDGRHIELVESDHTELDISPEEKELIHELASGEHGDPLELAGQSLKPEVYGHETPKQMLVLAMVGGSDVDDLRGEFHILLIGDPGTAKSELIDRVEEIAPRSVGVSGKGATVAGVTASAVQDDFGDGNAATLKAGALVKANNGVVCIDELDDMPTDVRAAMLEPMSKQTVHISKWGINARLATKTGVLSAANPKYGRFDQYEPTHEQVDLEANLLSRFDLVFVFRDQMDEQHDEKVADRILTSWDAKKREAAGEELSEEARDTIEGPVGEDILRKWIALAKQQPDPVFESPAVKQTLKERFTALRGMYDYAEDQPVPVTFRKLLAVARVAQAAAKFEFSPVITDRHAQIATEAVGESMRNFGMDEDGNYDADIQETGGSMSQRQKMKLLGELITEVAGEHEGGHAPIEEVLDLAVEEGLGENQAEHIIKKMKSEGAAYEPTTDHLRFVGLGQ